MSTTSVDSYFTNKHDGNLREFVSLLHSVRNESRCLILDVLSEKPQAGSVILRKVKDKGRRSRSGFGNLSFSNLPFHLHILEQNGLVKKDASNGEIGPKGYPIHKTYRLTDLGVYAKTHLPLFKKQVGVLKLLIGRNKKKLTLETRILLALLKIYYSKEKATAGELERLCNKASLDYYLKKIQMKNCWLHGYKARTNSLHLSKVPPKLKTTLMLLDHLQKDRSNRLE